MVSWNEIESAAPEFAARVKARFEAGTNKTLATLRADGSPRISASECKFEDGEVTLGMMEDSLKLLDVRRDPRFAIHSPTLEPPPQDGDEPWLGDAKMAGTLVEIEPPSDTPFEGAGFFKFDIADVALTYLGVPADHLVIESWNSKNGYQRRTRA